VTNEFKSKTVEVNPADFTKEKCWEKLENLAEILSVPGLLQAELKLSPKFGKAFDDKSKELLHLIVDSFDIAERGTDESVEKISKAINDIRKIKFDHLIEEVSIGALALQNLDISEVIIHMEKAEESDLPAGDVDRVRKFAENLDIDNDSIAIAKIHPTISKIIRAGVFAAGSEAAFTEMQMSAMMAIPESSRENPSVVLAGQITGALTKAIISKAIEEDMVRVTARSIIEMVIGAKQAICMDLIAPFQLSPENMIDSLHASVKRSILDNGEEVEEVEEDESQNMPSIKETSQVFSGNGTVN